MSEGSWFYVKDGQRTGPVALQTLQHLASVGAIAPDTMVWKEGLKDWAPSRQFTELAQSLGEGAGKRTPPIVPGRLQAPEPQGDATGGIIPYRNGPALAGYYTGVASLIPVAAIVLGPAAILLGVAGLRKARRTPQVSGRAHAIVAIVLGGLTFLANVAIIVIAAIAAA